MNGKPEGWRATPKTSQEAPGPRQTKVAKAGALALAAIEIYFKVYLKAVLERRRSAVLLHEKLVPFGNVYCRYGYLMKFVGRYEYYYERYGDEVMIGESFENFRVRHFTTVIDALSDVMMRTGYLRNRLPTFPTKRHDFLSVLHCPIYEEERTERLRKGGYWSSYECLRPARGGKPIRHGAEYDRLWTI
jgi:hypothetical protein